MKKIAILGSTGSIGKNTLEVIQNNKDFFKVESLACRSNIDEIEMQAKKFHPKIIAVYDKEKAKILKKRLSKVKILSGIEGLIEATADTDVDFVMSAVSGSIGLIPTVHAIMAKKTIGLANKEVMVSAGDYVNYLLDQYDVDMIPVDSEHSAIFQALNGEDAENIKRIILTASGGPFYDYSKEELKNVSLADALKHPTYKMGSKITIDSSTLMNKGLEIIEAYHLFRVEKDQIDVVVHPQSIIHSFVEFIDGSIISQMSEPDMQLPIQYAMTYPKRIRADIQEFDFVKNNTLNFFEPDYDKFLCLKLAKEALDCGKSMPCFMNAANEILVSRFLEGQIPWMDISRKLEKLMSLHRSVNMLDLTSILSVDKLARIKAKEI